MLYLRDGVQYLTVMAGTGTGALGPKVCTFALP